MHDPPIEGRLTVMFIATYVLTAVLAVVLLLSAYGKLTHNAVQTAIIVGVGFPEQHIWMLALCELAGALGIVIGLFWWPIGIAAAIGVVLDFVAAVGAQVAPGNSTSGLPEESYYSAIAVLVLRALTL